MSRRKLCVQIGMSLAAGIFLLFLTVSGMQALGRPDLQLALIYQESNGSGELQATLSNTGNRDIILALDGLYVFTRKSLRVNSRYTLHIRTDPKLMTGKKPVILPPDDSITLPNLTRQIGNLTGQARLVAEFTTSPQLSEPGAWRGSVRSRPLLFTMESE